MLVHLNKELIINAAPQGVEIALLEDKKLVELHHEKADASFAVGDLYLGKVKKLIPGLNAAFVDVGFEKDAFLHYTDLSPYARSLLKFTNMCMQDKSETGLDFGKFSIEPEIIKTGKINEVLGGKPHILVKILKEPTKTTSILRDLLNEDFNKIVVNDKNIFTDTKNYIQRIAPEKADIVSFYQNGSPIFDSFGITKQVKSSFGKTVNLNSGAYLIIEHTEALHVIDVNSGYKSVSNNQEQNALETNLEAAEEVARQLRLRDLGGIIVVDFIDMKFPDNKRRLMEKMEEFMSPDRAKHAVLPISKFGLMQITRQRMKPEMNINTQEVCPSCNGTGKISSTLLLEDEMEKNLSYLITHNHTHLTLVVNPIMYAYLTKGFMWNKKISQWRKKYKQKINILPNTNYHLTEFRFLDKNEEE